MLPVSLCVLAHDRTHLLAPLRACFESFVGLQPELVIADNSREPASRQFYEQEADVYVRVPDEVLWYDGFGAAKGVALRAARNDWCFVADLGESWRENPDWPVARAISECPDVPVWHIKNEHGPETWGRIADRKRVRLLGLIHEEFFERGGGSVWSVKARRYPPPVFATNSIDSDADDYARRKWALYDHLLDEVYHHPELRTGTNPYWYDTFWPGRLAGTIGTQPPTLKTFEEWRRMPG